MTKKEDKEAAGGPDLTPPEEPKIEPAEKKPADAEKPAEKKPRGELKVRPAGEVLADKLAVVFDKAKELGIDPGRGFERAAGYLINMGGWNRNRNANLFAIMEKAHAERDHLAMLDAAHEIAEGAKAKAGASAKVWEVIAPLLKKVFLGALA